MAGGDMPWGAGSGVETAGRCVHHLTAHRRLRPLFRAMIDRQSWQTVKPSSPAESVAALTNRSSSCRESEAGKCSGNDSMKA